MAKRKTKSTKKPTADQLRDQAVSLVDQLYDVFDQIRAEVPDVSDVSDLPALADKIDFLEVEVTGLKEHIEELKKEVTEMEDNNEGLSISNADLTDKLEEVQEEGSAEREFHQAAADLLDYVNFHHPPMRPSLQSKLDYLGFLRQLTQMDPH